MMNSRQKRMSAVNFTSPWRGPMVDASESGFASGNRMAAVFMYAYGVAINSTSYAGKRVDEDCVRRKRPDEDMT